MDNDGNETSDELNNDETTKAVAAQANQLEQKDFHTEEQNNLTNNSIKTIKNIYAEFDIHEIEEFEPDTNYIEKTILPFSYLIVTPEGQFCIDGSNYIADEIKNGKNTIGAFAEYWDIHSEEELAIRKFQIRKANTRELVYYIEVMKHVSNLKSKYLKERPDLIEFGVGGTRKNLDNSAKLNRVLSSKMELSLETISKYSTDIKYLSDAAINNLREFQKKPKEEVGLYPNKDFFETIRPLKVRATIEFESENLDYEIIEDKISAAVLKAYDQYRQKLPIDELSNKQKEENRSIFSVIDEIKEQVFKTGEVIAINNDNNNSDDKSAINQIVDQTKADIVQVAPTVPSIKIQQQPVKSSTVEDKIKELAEKIRKIADEPIDISEKKKSLSVLVNDLLRIVGSI